MKIRYNDENIEIEAGINGFNFVKTHTDLNVKDVIALKYNGSFIDLADTVHEGEIEVLTKNDIDALSILNHSTAHLLASAVMQLYPDTKCGIGPSIEEGFYYDFDFSFTLVDSDLEKIETMMKKLAKQDDKFTKNTITKKEAEKLFENNTYKLELINDINGDITIYTCGSFVDLCAGVHVPNTSYIKNFKLLNIAGAYWKGNSDNKQLTRIYGTSFYTKEDLENHLHILEERKLRDHRKLGKELGIFVISEYGSGMPIWLPNGMIIRNELENYFYDINSRNGYQFIKTPVMMDRTLWEVSGHWQNYRENMYTTVVDEQELAIKPMNCPGAMIVYNSTIHSYKDLPIKYGELGLVHRYEASGALHGLFRVRTFTQDDAHIFCREDQLQDEIVKMLALFDELYSVFGLSYHIELSTRPEEKYIGEISIWDKAEKALGLACEKFGKEYIVNPGDGAFYGPKLDFKLKDCMNRIWQCGTIQLDMNLPERFDLSYIDSNGEKVRPIMLHRAIFGSIERFIGILIENFSGAFPCWLAPIQVNILPVNNNFHLNYAKKVEDELKDLGIRVKLDDSNEKLGYRMRLAQINKIPFSLVIGDKEKEELLVTYRKYKSQEQITITLEEFKKMMIEIISTKKITTIA